MCDFFGIFQILDGAQATKPETNIEPEFQRSSMVMKILLEYP